MQRDGDLGGERERVKRLEEYGLDSEIGEAALVRALHLGGEQQHGNVGCDGIVAQFAEGGWTVHAGHHYVEQDCIGILLDGAVETLCAGAG